MTKLTYGLLAAIVVIAVIGGIAYNTPAAQDALFKRAASAVMAQQTESFDGLRVVVCGSASPLGNDPSRAQACIAVITPEHFLLFDVGARSPQRLAAARLPLGRLTGVFLTHFHSDHIAALPDVNMNSWVQGRPTPLQVYGPPGVETLVAGFNMAYRLDQSYRNAHHGSELLPLERAHMEANIGTPGEIVWQDDSLTVTSFAVEHPPIEPAVGYRIDYQDRAVVISGDTNASENLFTQAQGADLLFHDALSRTLLDPMIEVATAANIPRIPTIMKDVIDYHADSTTLAAATENAGIKQLVFYHMVPVPANALAAKMFMRNLPDEIILARDLHTFDLPGNSSDIVIHEP